MIDLTAVEYKLLQALMSSPGKAFSRDDLLSHIYERGETVVDRVIDVHIGHLRQKLSDDPAAPSYIETVRGFGYRFAEREKP
jgi:DNA-binding response OmpR family regulator